LKEAASKGLLHGADEGLTERFLAACEAMAGNAEDAVSTSLGSEPGAGIGTAAQGSLPVADAAEGLSGEGGALTTLDMSVQAAQWKRLSGNNRYETMQKIVQETYPRNVPSGFAILASGDNFPDALAASSLAGILDAPIILTAAKSLSPQARDELLRLKTQSVIIVGGEAAVSKTVEAQVKAVSGVQDVSRVYGGDRAATACAIYEAMAGTPNTWSDMAILVTGINYADALSVAPLAYITAAPIFLYDTRLGRLDPRTQQALTSGAFGGVLLVGGTGVLPDSILSSLGNLADDENHLRLAGGDRYLTSLAVAQFATELDILGMNGLISAAGLATGQNYPDALCGAALCGKLGVPLYLVQDSPSGRSTIYRSLAASHYANALSTGYIFGGTGVVVPRIENILKTLGTPTSEEQKVINLVNSERAKAGLPALKISPELQGVTDVRADEITMRFSHTRPNGESWDTAYWYDLQGTVFTSGGENIASGYATPEAVMQGWMNSPGHKANILDPDFTHIGVGYVYQSPGGGYWVQFFGQ
jgi:uncharacterized protein YkwD